MDRIRIFDLEAPDGSASAKIDLQILPGDHMLPTRAFMLYSGSTRNGDEAESWKNRRFLVGTNPGVSVKQDEIVRLVHLLYEQFDKWIDHNQLEKVQVDMIHFTGCLLALKEKSTSQILIGSKPS